jgi:O-antigen ligase
LQIDEEYISDNRNQTVPTVIVSVLLFLGIGFFMISHSPPSFPALFLFAFVIFVIAFVRADVALIFLILSMLLSPEFLVGGIPGRSVVIRVDDIFLFVIFFGWLAKMAVNKEFALLNATSLSRSILVYMFICMLASSISLLQGYTKPSASFFYLVKYFEYFFLFFMVSNSINSKNEVKMFVFFLILTSIIVTAYGWQLHSQGVSRIAAPFDTEGGGEANTLAGYLLLMISVTMGLAIYSRAIIQKVFLMGLLGFMVPTFLYTLSRGAWLGFIPMCVSIFIFTKKAKPLLLLILMIIVLAAPVVMPQEIKDRVTSTFGQGNVYKVLGKQVTLEASGAARIENMKRIIKKWYKRPFLGYGVSGVGLVDSQYARVLGETGIIGLLSFLWLMLSIFREGIKTLNIVTDDWARGVTLAFLAGFIGLLFQALTANTFIIVRIMGPFWFLVAIMMVFQKLYQNEELH